MESLGLSYLPKRNSHWHDVYEVVARHLKLCDWIFKVTNINNRAMFMHLTLDSRTLNMIYVNMVELYLFITLKYNHATSSVSQQLHKHLVNVNYVSEGNSGPELIKNVWCYKMFCIRLSYIEYILGGVASRSA